MCPAVLLDQNKLVSLRKIWWCHVRITTSQLHPAWRPPFLFVCMWLEILWYSRHQKEFAYASSPIGKNRMEKLQSLPEIQGYSFCTPLSAVKVTKNCPLFVGQASIADCMHGLLLLIKITFIIKCWGSVENGHWKFFFPNKQGHQKLHVSFVIRPLLKSFAYL